MFNASAPKKGFFEVLLDHINLYVHLWMMEKDRRYVHIKSLISGGYIKSFREIFSIIPKSVVARDLGMNNMRFSRLMNNVDQFSLKDILRLATFLEIDEMILINLVYQQFVEDKKSKKVKSKS